MTETMTEQQYMITGADQAREILGDQLGSARVVFGYTAGRLAEHYNWIMQDRVLNDSDTGNEPPDRWSELTEEQQWELEQAVAKALGPALQDEVYFTVSHTI